MAKFIEGNHFSAPAAADLSALQYKAVKLDSTGKVVAATAATDVILGVLDNTPVSGELASIWLRTSNGTFKVKLGGTVAVGDAVTSNGSSAGITTTTAGNQIIGYAVQAGVSGDIIEVMPSTAKY
ncbi:hypothetical protein SAMN04487914_10895 [Arthrobacter sp. ok909]|uniref:capsid cement protein n=1 Tax=Arthrobacter sp. ok909 TaxID=1761746 RepID=UPI00087FE0CE|nr:capsid cement protein [Arthrobacter sp. ok909]SDP33350.1 hypothetical protein SAMN04487914_10895 [Arthrobacter sp. ok909]